MTPLRIEPLSSVDAAWLGMENPTNLMMVTGIMTFAEPVAFERMQAFIEHRWLQYDRFRKRVARPQIPFAPGNWNAAFWEPSQPFQIKDHLHDVTLPGVGDQAELQDYVSRMMSTPLEFSRPPWEMHLVQNVNGGSALVARIHHCIADGLAMISVLLSIADEEPDLPDPEHEVEDTGPAEDGSLLEEAVQAAFQFAAGAANGVFKLSEKLLQEAIETLANPGKAMDFARQGSEGVSSVRHLLMMEDDPKTLFKGNLQEHKRAAWTRELSLPDVKEVKNTLGGTVNDVLVSVVAGALRRYLVAEKAEDLDIDIRAAIPVNLRALEDMDQLGNKFGLVFLSLPIGIANTVDRLNEIHERMNRLKNSPEPMVFYGLLKSMGYAPRDIQSTIVGILANKITAVMSNVPGPRKPLYIAGREVKEMMFWVPQSGRVGIGVSIFSYNDKVFVGVATDKDLVPHPERIVDCFYEEYEALLKASRAAARTSASKKPAPKKEATRKKTAAKKKPGAASRASRKPSGSTQGKAEGNEPTPDAAPADDKTADEAAASPSAPRKGPSRTLKRTQAD